MVYKILLLISLLLCIPAFAQDVEPPGEISTAVDTLLKGRTVLGDSLVKHISATANPVYRHDFPKDFQKKYSSPAFDYSESNHGESLWRRMIRRILEWLSKILRDGFLSTSTPITRVLVNLAVILVAGLILYFIVKYLLSRSGLSIFGKKKKEIGVPGEILHENIHEIDFPASIAKFENEGNFRMAVRYQFLFVLKKLTDRGLLIWNPEKTNHDYVREISSEPLRRNFSALSYIFDNVWYGEFEVRKEDYERFRTRFSAFKTNAE